MILARYAGSGCSEIGDREFNAVGQQAEMSEQSFIDAVIGGAIFIPEEYFLAIGFTDEELAQYGTFGERINPTDSFSSKLALAQQRCLEIRKAASENSFFALAEVSA
jgi:hypothetical protein